MSRSSRKTDRYRRDRAPQRTSRDRVEDQVLAILVDERNGREYYVSIIDVFTLDGTTYSVMDRSILLLFEKQQRDEDKKLHPDPGDSLSPYIWPSAL